MRRRFGHLGCTLLLLLSAGCKGLFDSRGLPADPLFAHRKPTETKSVGGPPQDVPVTEPRPPANTYLAR